MGNYLSNIYCFQKRATCSKREFEIFVGTRLKIVSNAEQIISKPSLGTNIARCMMPTLQIINIPIKIKIMYIFGSKGNSRNMLKLAKILFKYLIQMKHNYYIVNYGNAWLLLERLL